MIAIDTNVIAYLFIKGDQTEKAKSLLLFDSEWIAPILWRSEFRNVLTLYVRKKYFGIHDALAIMNEAENFMSENEYEVSSKDILRLANSSNCSAYDCEFVALAKSLNIKLYTSDKKILNEFPQLVASLNDFSNQ